MSVFIIKYVIISERESGFIVFPCESDRLLFLISKSPDCRVTISIFFFSSCLLNQVADTFMFVKEPSQIGYRSSNRNLKAQRVRLPNQDDGAPAECDEVEGGESCLTESPEGVKTLLCLLDECCGVDGGGQVIGQVHAQELRRFW